MVGASLLAGYLLGADFGKAVVPTLVSVLTVAFLWWRLYHDDDVLAYYDRIEEDARGRT